MFEVTIVTQISFAVMFASMVFIAALIMVPDTGRRYRRMQQRRQLEATLPNVPEERVKALIRHGIGKESQLEQIYRCVHADDSCLLAFPPGKHQEEALQLLKLLLEESREHKVTLQQLLISIQ